MDAAAAACYLRDEPHGGGPTPCPSGSGEEASGGEEAAMDECDVGTTGEDSAEDLRGHAAAGAAAPVPTLPSSTRPVVNASTAAAEAPGFVALLQAPPPQPSPQAPVTATLAAQVPAARAAPALPASATTGRRSAAGAASAGAGAAAVGAAPAHTRDVPVRASAAVALTRETDYKDLPEMKRLRSASDITREDLASCFHMPSEQACRKLGIGLTVLKRQCRKFGIKRWPFRKIKSLDRLINNVSAGIVPSEGGRVLLKSVEELEEQKRQMEVCAIHELDEETKRLQQAYSKANHKLRRQQEGLPPYGTARPRKPSTGHAERGGAHGGAHRVEEEYSDEEEEEEEEDEGWQAQVEEGDPNKRRRKPNPRYLDPPSKRVKKLKSHRPGFKAPPSLAALDADLLASLAEVAEKHAHGGGGRAAGGHADDAGAAGGDDDDGEEDDAIAAPKLPLVNLDIVREALQQHASCIATAIEAAYGAEATTTIRAALDAENQRLHGRIVGLLQLSAVV